MTGRLTIVGLGPGPSTWMTGAAHAAVSEADHVFGYDGYARRVAPRAGREIHASGNGDEMERARHALILAAGGRNVALVSGGDPGVFAMAAAAFEAIENGPAPWRALDVRVEPGVTAMLAAAARLGAPLGHDFCAISLSDNLKPWDLILRRLRLAAEADFVIALYNPASRARPGQIKQAFAALAEIRAAQTPVMFAHSVGRANERIAVTALRDAHLQPADMRTLVIVGSSATRTIERPDAGAWLYSPRSASAS